MDLDRFLEPHLNEMFNCIMGPPQAYFEVSQGSSIDIPPGRYSYSTILIGMKRELKRAEPILSQAFLDSLILIRRQVEPKPYLIWRIRPTFETNFFDNTTYIRARLAVPGVDLDRLKKLIHIKDEAGSTSILPESAYHVS